MTSAPPPPATGVRLPWSGLPLAVRTAVADRLGSPVVEADTQPGGFSTGVAARVRLADGRRAFVKAVGEAVNPDSTRVHRAEARITAALPPGLPVPRLLACVDLDAWVVLVLQDVAGATPVQPWRPADLRRVLDAYAELTEALDPAPLDAPPLAESDTAFRGFRLAAAGSADPAAFGSWAVRHLDRLAALEDTWTAAAAGTGLIHGDLRADNVLLTPDGGVVFVDWPHAAVGARWFDAVGIGGSVLMHNGPEAAGLLDDHLAARHADPDAVNAVLAAVTGYFLHHATLPAPAGLPTLRAFQRAQGEAALNWLRRRTDWV